MLKAISFFIPLFIFSHSPSFSQNWHQIGVSKATDIFEPNPGDLYPYGIGVIWSVKLEPQYDGQKNTRLYASGISSGLWLSEGGKGNDWQLLNTDFLPETSVGDFAINPISRNKIIIGTGLPKLRQSRNKDLFGLPKGKGVFYGTISRKNQVTWKLNPNQIFHDGANAKNNDAFWGERTKCVARLAYASDGTSIILVVIEEESNVKYHTFIYKSINGGFDWILKATFRDVLLSDMDFNPTVKKHIVLSCTSNPNEMGHFYESKDDGDTWNPAFTIFPELNEQGAMYKTSFDAEIPSQLWFCKTTTYSNQIFILMNGKLTATQTFRQWHNAGGCASFAISNYNRNCFSAGSLGLYCVANNQTYDLNKEIHSDIRAIQYYPKSRDMLVANDGGVSLAHFDSSTNQYQVTDVSNGLAIGRVTNISSISKSNYGFANWDNSCRWVSDIKKPKPFFDLFGNESTIFEINDHAILDGGAGPLNAVLYTFDSIYNLSQREMYIGDFFTFIPHEKKFFYINGTELHLVNFSASISVDRIVYTHPQGDKHFLQPKVALRNSNVIYTATQQQGAYYHFQIFKSADGGNHWAEFNTQPFGGNLTDLAIDPFHEEVICVGSTQGDVFFSSNSGLTFTNSSLPHEAGAVNTLTYINSKWVLAACDDGLWICNTTIFGDKIWRKFNDLLPRKSIKLPNCRITDVEYLSDSKIIRVATMGRGAFECDVKKLF